MLRHRLPKNCVHIFFRLIMNNVNIWEAYANKTVLLTGHTGFKGSWLASWLTRLGAKVVGFSLDVPSTPSNFSASQVGECVEDIRSDIRDVAALRDVINRVQPDFIFHLAAQALVRRSYAEPLETISSNALGTTSVLEALRSSQKPLVAVMITSDKAYDNLEWVWGYRETDRLGGKDPYSASKGMAELAIRSYVDSFFKESNNCVRLGIARAGNVIGGGDWAADRIVPDCVRAWANHQSVDIRSPNATRPWQHVLEPLSGYLSLGANLQANGEQHGEAYNFGPSSDQDNTVRALIDAMAMHWSEVRWNDVSKQEMDNREAGLLKLNCDKALNELSWRATLRFEETVAMTAEWYKEYYSDNSKSMRNFTLGQIETYMRLFDKRSLNSRCYD